MWTLIEILGLLDRLTDKRDIAENEAALRFVARFADMESQSAWTAAQSAPGPHFSQVAIFVDGSDVALEAGASFVPTRRYRFSLVKQRSNHELRLFYSSSATRALIINSTLGRIRIADLPPEEAFLTKCSIFEPWTDEDAPPFSASGIPIDPSKRVFDLAEPRLVPNDLRSWLIASPPDIEGAAYVQWKQEAALRVWASLVDQVAGSTGTRRFRLSGPPALELQPDDTEIAGAFRPLQAAAEWVFVETTDQDARHLLFAIELAQTLRVTKRALGDAVPVALENAKSAYRAHLQSANRETLKALGELRKAVIEETQKTVQRTQDLTNALWRDMIVAAAPFVLKIMPDAAKISSETVSTVFLLGAAAYLFCSILATSYINGDYFREQTRARKVWQASLTRYLSVSETKDISETPIYSAAKTYRNVHVGVCVFYTLMIIALLTAVFLT